MPRGKEDFGIFDVTAERVVDAHRLADLAGRGPDVFNLAAENQSLDLRFDPVVQLVAIRARKNLIPLSS